MFSPPMSNLTKLLAARTAAFNVKREQGSIPNDQSARADLSKLDLSNAEPEDCTVSDTDFRETDLCGAFIHGISTFPMSMATEPRSHRAQSRCHLSLVRQVTPRLRSQR